MIDARLENLSQEVGKMLSGLNEYLIDQIKLHSLTTEN